MKPYKIIPKIAFYDSPRSYEFILFFPESRANYGRIECYARIGQNSEASQGFFKENTLKPTEANIKKARLDKADLDSLISEWANLGEFTPYKIVSKDSHSMRKARWNLKS